MEWPVFKLNNRLFFWLDLKFLIFDSYFFNISFEKLFVFNYVGYFPLHYFNFYFDLSYGFNNKFSIIQNKVTAYKFKFFRKIFQYFYDVDFHISFVFLKGFSLAVDNLTSISYFKFLRLEYFFMQGFLRGLLSFIIGVKDNEIFGVVNSVGFFKKKYCFKILLNFGKALVFNFFSLHFFYKKFFTVLIEFLLFFFLKNLKIFYFLLFFLNFYYFFFFFIYIFF